MDKFNKREIAIYFTGGTISMTHDSETFGVVPASKFPKLIEELKLVMPEVSIRLIYWSDLPSPHITPGQMYRLAKDIELMLEDPSILGAVVIHGTDVMEETSYMLELVVDSPKPIVVTGAMRYYGEPGYDGLRNIICSVKACLSPESRNMGTMILMADRILSPHEAIKVHSSSLNAFDSPGGGSVGFSEGGHISFIRRPCNTGSFKFKGIETKVDLVKLNTGDEGNFIRFSKENGARGIVLEGFGAGNIPSGAVSAVEQTIKQGIPVVLVTCCIQGGVYPIYAYPGGGKALLCKGIILGGRLNGPKARILLMLAIGSNLTMNEIKEIFKSP